jgi:hypothetical protein
MTLKLFVQPSFTRFGNLDHLKLAFKRAPKQVAGSPDAFEGLVAEFEEPDSGKTFTCSEIFEEYKYKKFLVRLLDGRIITVLCDNGRFFIKDNV